jgi:photosystem II stability/assembly factor-like uncharacterized protein
MSTLCNFYPMKSTKVTPLDTHNHPFTLPFPHIRETYREVKQRILSARSYSKEWVCGILLVMACACFFLPNFSWAQQKLYDDLFSVSFPSELEGWACGRWGTVLHTSDGGLTWSPQNSGTNFALSSIFFVDPHQGWAVGDEGTIIHTSDGGKTWEKQKSPIPFFLMDLYFDTPLKGWIVTEQTHILYTDDGGKTWSIQFREQDFILKAVSFCDSLHGWAVGEYGYIYHTRDGGSKWENQAGHFDVSETSGEVEGGTFLFDVQAIDPRTAWAVGIDGYVIKTEDGGKGWEEVQTGASQTQLFCITTDRADTILIGGNGVFLSSSDKGQSWKVPVFEPTVTYGWIYGLTQRPSSGFVGVGWDGAIYLNTSNNWHRVNY